MAEAVTEGNCTAWRITSATLWKPCGCSQAFEVLPAFAFQFARLDQQEPASRRKIVGQMSHAPLATGTGARGEGQGVRGCRRCHLRLHCVHAPTTAVTSTVSSRSQAPLALHLKRPDRFDFVAEQLDPHGLEPVGSKNVDDAAATGELAGQLYGGRVLIAAGARATRRTRPPKAARRPAACGSARPDRDRLGTGCNKAGMLVTSTLGGFGPSSVLSTRTRSPTASSWTIRCGTRAIRGRETAAAPAERRGSGRRSALALHPAAGRR